MEPRDNDVADSTDWLGTALACLMPVEQALRCHVCKDLYTSPMLTSCNHTFCSLCIRRCLAVDGKCPLCRMGDQESKLRGNWALREAVDAFCKARPVVLAVARRPRAPSPRATTPPKRKAGEEGAAVAAEEPAAASSGGADEPPTKRTRTSARLSKTKAAEAVASMAQAEVEDAEAPAPAPAGAGGRGGDKDYEPDDSLVACPICWTRMKPWQVYGHIDTSCSGSPQKPTKTATQSSTSTTGASIWTRIGDPPPASNPFSAAARAMPRPPPPERLPSLSYSLLTDAALRKKMAALGLSTAGPRQLLERRHKEWTTLWNANCDSAQPKRKAELLHDLDVWDRTVGSGVASSSSSGGGGHGGGGGGISGGSSAGSGGLMLRSIAAAHQQAAQIKDKDFDAAAWSARHSASFRDLIANARKSRSKTGADSKDKDQTADSSSRHDKSKDEARPDDGSPAVPKTPPPPAGPSLPPPASPHPAAVVDRDTCRRPPDAAAAGKENGAVLGLGKRGDDNDDDDGGDDDAEAPSAGGPGPDVLVVELP